MHIEVSLEMEEQLRFETLIADLSLRFVNVPADLVDGGIEDAQRAICECLGLEHSSLWQTSIQNPDELVLTHLYRVMAPPPHKLKKDKLLEGAGGLRILDDVGVKVHKLKGLKLHAKLLLADNVRGIVESINPAPGSFDSRHECAIEVRDEGVVGRLHEGLTPTGRTRIRSICPRKACSQSWKTWMRTLRKTLPSKIMTANIKSTDKSVAAWHIPAPDKASPLHRARATQ